VSKNCVSSLPAKAGVHILIPALDSGPVVRWLFGFAESVGVSKCRGKNRFTSYLPYFDTHTHQHTINNQQSTINNHQSTINNQQSTINNHQSPITNQQSTINNQQSTINNPDNRKLPVPISTGGAIIGEQTT